MSTISRILNRSLCKISDIVANKIQFFRNISHDNFTCGYSKVKTPLDTHYEHFLNLKLPENKLLATYVWIDGTGISLRSKDRVLDHDPCDLSMVPQWSFDGSSTAQAQTNDSDVLLVPCAVYKDPFRKSPHILVLCETYQSNGTPTATNHRFSCAKLLNDIADKEPWFGIEQEYTLFDADLWPLGWPKGRGFPVIHSKCSYCGVGEHVAGRDLVENHARASIYAGVDYGGSNAEVMKGSWEFQVGVTSGIKAADDLWIARYILSRVSEHFGAIVSYHPKPMGKDQPGIGCHHNFSTLSMRTEGGLKEIERTCKILGERHEKDIKSYGLGDNEENKKRLTGKFETASYETYRWGIADRGASVRVQRSTAAAGKGFLEDRRPAGDCDPYRVCAIMAETCHK